MRQVPHSDTAIAAALPRMVLNSAAPTTLMATTSIMLWPTSGANISFASMTPPKYRATGTEKTTSPMGRMSATKSASAAANIVNVLAEGSMSAIVPYRAAVWNAFVSLSAGMRIMVEYAAREGAWRGKAGRRRVSKEETR